MINNLLILASLAQGICSSICFPPLLMARFFFVLLFPAVLLATPLTAHAYDCSAQTEILQAECEALVAFYNATNGDNWTNNTGWLSDPIASWFGVAVGGTSVRQLLLGNNGLSGTLPAELGNLTNLQYLYLNNNALTGSIPAAWGDLSSLIRLLMQHNSLTGSIPAELGNLNNLEILRLSSNSLTGNIPASLSNLANLERLILNENSLSGSIPPELGNLVNLDDLTLHRNTLTGAIPLELGNLSNLTRLLLGENALSGSIPPELGNLANLEHLSIHTNSLSGELPEEIGTLTNLTGLFLHNNLFSGSIPLSFTNLPLTTFWFVNTSLCEPQDPDFQAWISGIPSFQSTGVACAPQPFACATQAEIPEAECDALVALYNSTNGSIWVNDSGWLSNPITSWFGVTIEDGHVQQLELVNNLLIGSIPATLGNLTNLQTLSLHSNQLNGVIPPELGNLTNLEVLYLHSNDLTGSIPPTLGNLINLELLALSTNSLTGIIPPELGNLVNLELLALVNNSLSGTIPSAIGNLSNLTVLALFHNALTGEVPTELGNLTNLEELHLHDNGLTGSVPLSFTSLSLDTFLFQNTSLCEPQDPDFQTWLSGIPNLQSTGIACAPQSFDCTAQTEIPDLECNALVALYNATDGENWADNSGWLNDPISGWYGVTISAGHVQELALHSNSLSGTIPTELGNLSDIQNLYLYSNDLTGSIPPELGNLGMLERLSLFQNELTGNIPPELGNLSSLQNLQLSYNDLSGSIPTDLGNLANLDWLSLQDNALTGNIPTELGNLSNLYSLDLSNNALTGSIPAELGSLLDLQRLTLSNNNLTGSIPPGLGNLTDLQRLFLQFNQLTGSIPSSLGNLSNVRELYLSDNALSGNIPAELGNLSGVEQLNLRNNSLTGPVPSSLGNLANLQRLWLYNNPLTGSVPLSFINLTLTHFYYHDTSLCEPPDPDFQAWLTTIPNRQGTDVVCEAEPYACAEQNQVPEIECEALVTLYNATDGNNWNRNSGWLSAPIPFWEGVIVNGGHVKTLSLENNSLSGSIPSALGNLSELNQLNLQFNELTGPLPVALSNLANLIYLRLSSNGLTGNIPAELSTLSNLQDLSLWGNAFSGNIPPELGNLSELKWLALGSNQLSGNIPPELGNLSNLTVLYLFETQLSGSIPPELGNLSNLEILYLFETPISGSIPPEFGNLSSLWLLSVYGTELSGPLPPELGNLSNLVDFRIQRTELSGSIPLSFTNLPLGTFYYYDTNVCEPQDPDFQAWLTNISDARGTNVVCEESFSCATQSEIPEIECEALVAFYNSTDGDNWDSNAGWLTDPISQWTGVNIAEGHVRSIASSQGFGGNNLTGDIPPEIGNLAYLEYLQLSDNALTSIPPELGNLAHLVRLNLSINALTSIPPELGNLANLERLELFENQLSGNIPPELGNLTNLIRLDLFGNQLSGTIPPELGNLANLVFLDLCSNTLSGSVPPELGDLANAEYLRLRDNSLTGTIPSALSNLPKVQEIWLNQNDLSGSIPPELGNLTTLEELHLDENSLSGPIPAELSNLPNLEELFLHTNNLTGPIPSELGSLPQLDELRLNNNPLTGQIPLSFVNLALRWFHFNDTNLCEPQDPGFQDWLSNIEILQRTGVACEIIQPVLTVTSQNPDNGVDITISPADIDDEANGSTAFTRTYDLNTPVTLTAPGVTTEGNFFAGWLLDGQSLSDNPLQITMGGDHMVTALFETPTCTLSVASEDPAANVLISVSLTDLEGFGDGTTPFSRTYVCGTEVTLTAPPEAGSNVFTRWLLDNSPETNAQALAVTVDANRATTAVYGFAPRTLTVNSQNPEAGVEISVSPSATNGLADGTTAFTRTYDDGTNVTLTAPEMAPNGNPFTEWQLDGTTATTNLSLLVAMNASHAATAVYGSPSYTINVGSQNPDSGIPIMVSPADENSEGDGLTAFSRTYTLGTPITLTAPETSPEGNPFGKWACGATETMETTVAFSVSSNATCTAYFLIPPDGGSTETDIGETVILRWSDIPGADRYHVQVSDEPSFGKLEALVVDTDTVTVSHFDVPPGLLSSEQNFFWRIRSGITNETTSRWSDWSNQSVIPTLVERLDDTIPSSFTLENYPNPFNPSTTIRYALPEAGDVTLVVFDATGRHIVTLVNGAQPAGLYEATFEAGDLPSGTYFFRLEQGTYRETRAMLLVK